jgi:hypothetical protein
VSLVFTVEAWVGCQFAYLFKDFLCLLRKGFRRVFELLISLFGVFSDSLRSAVGQRSVFSLVLFFTFSPFACFKEKEKEFISSFLFEAFKKKKKDFIS